MKFVLTADLHIRGKRPRMRKDDYITSQFRKLKEIVETAVDCGAYLLIAGDIFDRADVSLNIIRQTITALWPIRGRCFIVRGNHCTLYHNKSIDGSPLGILVAAGVCTYIDDRESVTVVHGVVLHGMGWQGEATTPWEGDFNILMAHFSVYEDKPPFYMPEALSVLDFEDRYPGFDFYLAGDIHDTCKKSKTIVPGSMMRNTSAQQSHKPCVFVLDTETKETEQVFLTVEDNVFDLEEIEKIKNEDQVHQEVEARLLTMTQRMNTADDVVDFQANLTQVSESSSEAVKSIIREVA